MRLNGVAGLRQEFHLFGVGGEHRRFVTEVTVAPEAFFETGIDDGKLLEPVEARGEFAGLRRGQIGFGQFQLREHFINFLEAFAFCGNDALDVFLRGFEEFCVVGQMMAVGVFEQGFPAFNAAGKFGGGVTAQAERREDMIHGVFGKLEGLDDMRRGLCAVNGCRPIQPDFVHARIHLPGKFAPGIKVDAVQNIIEQGIIGLSGAAGKDADAAVMPDQLQAFLHRPIRVCHRGGGKIETPGGLAGDLILGDFRVRLFVAKERGKRRVRLAVRIIDLGLERDVRRQFPDDPSPKIRSLAAKTAIAGRVNPLVAQPMRHARRPGAHDPLFSSGSSVS